MKSADRVGKIRDWPLLLLSMSGILLVVFLCAYFLFQKDPERSVEPINRYQETLVVVADADYEPYSFFDQEGNPAGYDVEMIYALADAMQKNVEIRLTSWNDAIASMKDGTADLLLGLEYTPKDLPYLELSMPLHNDGFVAFGKERYSNISTLYEKKLAALENSGSYPLFLTPYRLESQTTAYESYSEAFRSVALGENDYVIVRYSVGRRAAARCDEAPIKAVGPMLASNDFCIGAAVGNAALIEEVNQAIIKTRSDGTLDALADKWLGQYVEIINLSDFLKQYAHILLMTTAVLTLLLAVCFVYVYRMRLQLAIQSEQQLLDRAARDPMTHLFHKNAADGLIGQIIADSPPGSRHAFFMVDIDNFKSVNDTKGHDFGDVAIMEFATALKGEFRDQDIVSRMGGDEFTVFFKDITTRQALEAKAHRLSAVLHRQVTLGTQSHEISSTIGIALYPDDGTNFETLYRRADLALYAGKRKAKGGFVFFEDIKEAKKEEDSIPQ